MDNTHYSRYSDDGEGDDNYKYIKHMSEQIHTVNCEEQVVIFLIK